MVKLWGNLNRWLTTDKIRELLNWSPEDINLLINGLSPLTTKSSDGRIVVVNLLDLRKYLVEVKKLADSLSGAPPPKKAKNKIPKPEKEKNDIKRLTGKEAAEKLNCSYGITLELINKHGLPAKKHGKGWHLNPEELEKFSSANQELIHSLKTGAGGNSEKPQDTTAVPEKPHPEDKSDTENPQKDDPAKEPTPNQNDAQTQSDKQAEPAKETSKNSDPAANQEKGNTPKFVTIRLTKYGCKVDDVAMALSVSIVTVRKWISDGAVKTKNGPGESGEERYVEPESLRVFLLKQRNTSVTFNEIKFVIKKLHWPDLNNPTQPKR